VTYLILKELKQLPKDLEITKTSHFNPDPKTVGELYKTIRANVIEVVFREWKRTGLFWEQYHDTKGVGCCNKPFNGWTTLIALIVTEYYL
jgi:mannosyl-oligosaccharide glucosidase